MGKKPVFGMAGLLVAGLALCGCKGNNHCPSGTCGDHHGGIPPGAHSMNGPSKNTFGQPPGSMVAGPTGTAPGTMPTGGGQITGFNQTGTSSSQFGSSFQQRQMGTTPRTLEGMAPMSGTSGRPMMSGQDQLRPTHVTTPGTSGMYTMPREQQPLTAPIHSTGGPRLESANPSQYQGPAIHEVAPPANTQPVPPPPSPVHTPPDQE